MNARRTRGDLGGSSIWNLALPLSEQEIGQWLESSYRLVMRIDDPELGKKEFAILQLLERKP